MLLWFLGLVAGVIVVGWGALASLPELPARLDAALLVGLIGFVVATGISAWRWFGL
jgi:hypothetical protein